MRYYKIFEKGLRADGIHFKKGLNKDLDEGVCFSDEEHIMKYASDAPDTAKISEILIPEGETAYPVGDPEKGLYHAHSIFVRNPHDLWTAKTFRWLRMRRVEIKRYDPALIDEAIRRDNPDVLKKLLLYTNDDLDCFNPHFRQALEKNDIHAVRMLLENGLVISPLQGIALVMGQMFKSEEMGRLVTDRIAVS